MSNILTVDTAMNEPRRIVIPAEGRRRFLPFLPVKEIVISIPNPSIRQAQKLRQKYYAFASAWVNKDERALAGISMDIVAGVFKSCRPIFTKWWIKRILNDAAFTQIVDFILAPTREKEEEYLKNALTLQKAVEKQV
jgi:hypothetical protein